MSKEKAFERFQALSRDITSIFLSRSFSRRRYLQTGIFDEGKRILQNVSLYFSVKKNTA